MFAVRGGESDGGDHGPTLNLPEVYCFRYLYFSFTAYYVIKNVDQAGLIFVCVIIRQRCSQRG